MIKCLNCGAENDDSANFCGKCGSNLKEQNVPKVTYKCPKCGAEFEEKKDFCTNCGAKFIWQNEERKSSVLKNKPAKSLTENPLLERIMTYVCYGLAFVPVVLALIALFVKTIDLIGGQTLLNQIGIPGELPSSFKLYFDTMWDNTSLKEAGLFAFLMFIVALGTTTVCGIVYIIRALVSGVKGEFKVFPILLIMTIAPVLIFGVASASVFTTQEKVLGEEIALTYGPSVKLSLSALVIAIVVLILRDIFVVKTKKSIVSMVFSYIVPVITIVVLFTTFFGTIGMAMDFSGITAKGKMNFYNVYIQYINYSGISTTSSIFLELMVVYQDLAILFTGCALIMALMAIGNNKSKAQAASFSMAALFMNILLFIFNSLTINSLIDDEIFKGADYFIGTPIIVGLIFSIILTTVAMVSLSLSKKENGVAA